MTHIKDRESLHDILEAVLDAIERMGDDNYVTFDVSTYSLGVRAAVPAGREGWNVYESFWSADKVGPEQVRRIIDKLENVEFSGTKQDADTTGEE